MENKILELMEKMGELKARLNISSLDNEHKQYRQNLFKELFEITKELNLYSDEEKRKVLFCQKHKEIVRTFLAIEEVEKPAKKDDNFFLIIILLMILHNEKNIEAKAFLQLGIAMLFLSENKNENRFGFI